MDSMTCPQCGAEMVARQRGGIPLAQCSGCEGIFLTRAELGLLIEEENEWHVSSGPATAPIPRILPGMTAPPKYAPTSRARSYIDELFG